MKPRIIKDAHKTIVITFPDDKPFAELTMNMKPGKGGRVYLEAGQTDFHVKQQFVRVARQGIAPIVDFLASRGYDFHQPENADIAIVKVAEKKPFLRRPHFVLVEYRTRLYE